MRALVTGATGTVGRALVARLDREPVIVSRRPALAACLYPRATVVPWDGVSPLEPRVLDGIDVAFHLAGESGDCRWTAAKCARLRSSRVEGTRALVTSLARAGRPCRLVSVSSVGLYGSRGDEPLTEESTPGTGFVAELCRAWEDEAARAEAFGIDVVTPRLGIVLARGRGSLARLLPLFRVGLAVRLGRGDQWMPWIHADDAAALLVHAATTPHAGRVLNAVAPTPMTNDDFTRALAAALGRPALPGVPEAVLRLVLGDLADAVLASHRVLPERAVREGFAFAFPTVEDALADLCPALPPRPGDDVRAPQRS